MTLTVWWSRQVLIVGTLRRMGASKAACEIAFAGTRASIPN